MYKYILIIYSSFQFDKLAKSKDNLMQKQTQNKQILIGQMKTLTLAQQRKQLTPQGNDDLWFQSSSDQSDIDQQKNDVRINIQEKECLAQTELNKEQAVVKNKKQYKQKQKLNYKSFDHNVDDKYIILLIVMNASKMINIKEISGLKNGFIELSGKFKKVSVKTDNQQDAKTAIAKISDYIDNLNLQKLGFTGSSAVHLQNFRKLKQSFRKVKIVIFGYGNKDKRQLLIGGQMKPSQLKLHAHHLKQYKINTFVLRKIKNSRTYKYIIDHILQTKQMRSILAKNQINLCQVQLNNHQKSKSVRILFTSTGKRQFTPNQYQDLLMKQIDNFYILDVLIDIHPQYIQKLPCQSISIKYIRQSKYKRSQLILIGHKDNFIKNIKTIQQYLQKINDNIIGFRFLDYLNLSIQNMQINRQKYYIYKSPHQKYPYSIYLFKNKAYQQKFDWRSLLQSTINMNEQKNKEEQL